MDILGWFGTRDWAATGAMITAGFTGATAWMMWRSTRKKVEWAVTGTAHRGYDGGRPTGTNVAELEVHNVGDGDTYDVRLTRCNGGELKPWETFEAARLNSGESFAVTFDVRGEDWGRAWFEITFLPTRKRGQKPIRSRRYLIGEIAGTVMEHRPDPSGRVGSQARGKRPAA